MRLFIALNFDNSTIDRLVDQQESVKHVAVRGNYSHRDNLHLTLAFIGERPVEDVPVLGKIVDSIEDPSFPMSLDHRGYFARNGRDIWWVGIAKNPQLESLQRNLVHLLRSAGFPIEKRKFTAHITLSRDTRLARAEDHILLAGPIHPIRTTAKRISLMESTRIDGRLTYLELHGKDLLVK